MRNVLIGLFLAFSAGFCQKPPAIDLRPHALSLLEISLTDKNPDTRKQAVASLGLLKPGEPWLSKLDGMLEDKDVEVQLATVATLEDLKSPRTLATLRKALDNSVPEVSFAAAKALWTLNDVEGREALISVLSGETKTSSGFLTRQKREALRMLRTPKTAFLFALKEGVSLAPVPGLGAGVSSLQGILSDPNFSGRATAALLLSTDKTPAVLAALRDALADPDWSVRAASVHAIAIRNDPTLAADLIPLFDDKKEAVRLRAAAGYIRLEDIRATSARAAAPKKQKKK